MAYTVIRTDLLSGTDVAADLCSAIVCDAEGDPIEVENGTIIKLGDSYTDDNREIYKATIATNSDDKADCAIVASPEVPYDERKKNLDEFVNEAGSIVRAYIPRSRNVYSVTKEGFADGTVGEKENAVGIKDGKLDTSGTGWGKIVDIESNSRYTYYAIRID